MDIDWRTEVNTLDLPPEATVGGFCWYILGGDDGHTPVPADMFTAGEWFEQAKNRTVALTRVRGYEVSTIFLGFDHGWGATPQWFETMVFARRDHTPELDFQWRYETWDEAVAGHKRVVQALRQGKRP